MEMGSATFYLHRPTKKTKPPLKIQKQIITEVEAEQKIINQNKKLIKIINQKIKTKIGEVWGE